jgi:hypothetical protein
MAEGHFQCHAVPGIVRMISDEQKRKAKERVVTELTKILAIAFYLWVVLSLLEIHRFVVLREVSPASVAGYRIGFAAINALILSKVIIIGQALHVGERGSEKRLVNSALFKSAIFALLLICFDIIEEVIVGLIHGKSITASIPQLGGGGLEGKILVGIMAFVFLIPFFLFIEMQRVLGKDKLQSLIVHKRSNADAA